MSAEKRSISAPENLFAQADERKEQLGYANFSDYIQALIRADVVRGESHLREVSSSPGLQAGAKIVDAAAAHARGATTEPKPPTKPVKYKVARS